MHYPLTSSPPPTPIPKTAFAPAPTVGDHAAYMPRSPPGKNLPGTPSVQQPPNKDTHQPLQCFNAPPTTTTSSSGSCVPKQDIEARRAERTEADAGGEGALYVPPVTRGGGDRETERKGTEQKLEERVHETLTPKPYLHAEDP